VDVHAALTAGYSAHPSPQLENTDFHRGFISDVETRSRMIGPFRSGSARRGRARERRPALDGDRIAAWLLAGLGATGVVIWTALVAWALG
jgi:hypothetical protein